MYVNSYKITVMLEDGATSVVFDDSVNAGAGSSAYVAIQAGQAVEAVGAIGEGNPVLVIIPYESVLAATVELTRSEAADPTDPTCVTE